MNSSRIARLSLFSIFLSSSMITSISVNAAGCSWQQIKDEYLTKKNAAIAAVVFAIWRLGGKSDPASEKERVHLGNLWSKLTGTKIISKDFFNLLVAIVDDIVIGYQGKSGGLKPYGSKFIVKGAEQQLGSYIDANGVKIDLYSYKSIEPYGLIGTLYAQIKTFSETLKPLIEAKNAIKEIKDISDKGLYDWFLSNPARVATNGGNGNTPTTEASTVSKETSATSSSQKETAEKLAQEAAEKVAQREAAPAPVPAAAPAPENEPSADTAKEESSSASASTASE